MFYAKQLDLHVHILTSHFTLKLLFRRTQSPAGGAALWWEGKKVKDGDFYSSRKFSSPFSYKLSPLMSRNGVEAEEGVSIFPHKQVLTFGGKTFKFDLSEKQNDVSFLICNVGEVSETGIYSHLSQN